ncbi:hypothetical protein AgCh_020081 [Apium graveolens]
MWRRVSADGTVAAARWIALEKSQNWKENINAPHAIKTIMFLKKGSRFFYLQKTLQKRLISRVNYFLGFRTYPPHIKAIAGKEITLRIQLNDDNIILNSSIYYAIDAYDTNGSTSSMSANTVASEISNSSDMVEITDHGHTPGSARSTSKKIKLERLRSLGNNVIHVAYSRIAATFLPRGETAHCRFHIPLKLDQCLVPGKALHFMDNRAYCEESSLELIRELLITISYSVPDKKIDSGAFETFEDEDKAVKIDTDEVDDIRSKLISISSKQSPDSNLTRCNGHP